MSLRHIIVCALLLSSGCYASGEPDAPVDVGPVDAPRGICDPVGSMRACGLACGGTVAPCEDPARRLTCFSIDRPLMAMTHLCIEGAEVITEPGVRDLPYGCRLPDGPFEGRMFAHRGDHACWRMRRPEELSVTEADCVAVQAAFGDRCYWSDGSPRTRSPPPVHTTCPAAPRPGSVLCGGPCGHCRAPSVEQAPFGTWNIPCVGRNDDRDLGVCGISPDSAEGCSPDTPASSLCPPAEYVGLEYPETRDGGVDLGQCVCLSFRRADGFEAAGWPVPRSNCTTYRALYPGEVECFDDTWTPLP